MKAATARVEAQVKAGETPEPVRQADRTTSGRSNSRRNSSPTPEQQAKEWDKEMATYRGGYVGIVKHRACELLIGPDLRLPAGRVFFAGRPDAPRHGPDEAGRLLGRAVAAVLPRDGRPGLRHRPAAHGLRRRSSSIRPSSSQSEYFLHGGVFYNAFGSLVVALGHVGLVMLIVQSGALDLADPPAGRRGPDGA